MADAAGDQDEEAMTDEERAEHHALVRRLIDGFDRQASERARRRTQD